jgi:hypothetical protein
VTVTAATTDLLPGSSPVPGTEDPAPVSAGAGVMPVAVIPLDRGDITIVDDGTDTAALSIYCAGREVLVRPGPAELDDLIAALQDVRAVLGDRADDALKTYADTEEGS